jgi:hypothetical protein
MILADTKGNEAQATDLQLSQFFATTASADADQFLLHRTVS